MNIILCGLLGYFIGNINPSYIMGKIKGFDIRESGSGNAGASNAVLLMGKKVGAFSAIFDIMKAYFAVSIAGHLFPNLDIAREIAGVSCIMGHIFPVFMRFKGGKGLACIGGSIMAYNLKLFLILLTIEVILALITDYICVIPLTVAIAVPVLYAKYCQNILGLILLVITAVVIIYKHMENIRRIIRGREARISYLWNPDKEVARLKKTWAQEESED